MIIRARSRRWWIWGCDSHDSDSLMSDTSQNIGMKNYTAIIKKSGNQFVAMCLELSVVGCGQTRSKAVQSLLAAIESYQEYATEVGLPETRPVAIQRLHEFLF